MRIVAVESLAFATFRAENSILGPVAPTFAAYRHAIANCFSV